MGKVNLAEPVSKEEAHIMLFGPAGMCSQLLALRPARPSSSPGWRPKS